ncbi:MAG: ECF transporter S component [Bacteroidales bacterium 36-12]|nr:MAG: ECF transporter S component [Bacteroidales bacterium 36-12]
MITNINLYNYGIKSYLTYVYAFLFIAGNIILPQLVHIIPNGGPMLLPIYFFTLFAAYKYGLATGLLTAVLSPVVNSLLFGMPVLAFLPVILVKSVLLATVAALIASRQKTVSIISLLIVVLSYQIIGSLVEWAIVKDFFVAVQDFRIGIPGMLLQIIGVYLLLKIIRK